MSLRSRLSSFIRNLSRRESVERDLDDELQAYLDLSAAEHERAGMSGERARREAHIQLRGAEQVKDRVRDIRTGATIEQLWRDVAYGVRMAARNRGFTVVAVATLALGIGASTATFSIVDTVVFRPLPYADSGRLVKIWGSVLGRPVDVSYADFRDLTEQSRVFEHVAADDGSGVDVVYEEGAVEYAHAALVTPQWLDTLGVRPVLGRGFLVDEAQPGRGRVLILTDAYWRTRFRSDPAIVGRTLIVDGDRHSVIGVLPANVLRYGADFVKPLVPVEYRTERGHRDLDVVARLRPGVSPDAAQAELALIARRLELAYPDTNAGRSFRVVPLGKYYALVDPANSRGLVLMCGAAALVLLIACVNVANLLLARAAARSRECVIRAALGAGRGRIVCQLLVENMLLFVTGGALGALLAWWTTESMVMLAKAEGYVPERMIVSVDGRVLVFSLAVSLATGLVFGLAPAFRASKVDVSESLRESAQALSGHRRGGRTRRLLIVSELSLSLVLLVGFGLLIRSFISIQATAGGFVPELLFETGSDGGRSFPTAVGFWRAVVDRAGAFPGVESVAVTSRPPVHGAREQRFVVNGRPDAAPGEDLRAGDILISADYFRTMSIPLVRGRVFTEGDTHTAPPVVIVSETLARRYFPGEDPIGRRLRVNEQGELTCCVAAGPVENVWREIVGIVGDIRQNNLDEAPAATLYRPYTQIVEHDMLVMVRVRSAADSLRVAAGLPAALRAVDPTKPWSDLKPMQQVISESGAVKSRRFILILLGGFAGLALLLAAVGLYGVMTDFVGERRREIAVRMALGATSRAVMRHVLGEAARLVAAGLIAGSLAAFALTRLISSLLFGVTPTDAATYVAVSGVLAAVALLAGYVPARLAARVDPIVILRES